MSFPVTCRTGEIVSNYKDYLQTTHWREIRSRYWESKYKKCCEVCKKENLNLDLHHKSYKRLGNEYLSDFILLCRNCHTGTHIVYKQPTSPKDNLWNAHKKLSRKQRKDDRKGKTN